MSECRFYHISLEGELDQTASLTEALDVSRKGGFLWLDYVRPTKEDLLALAEPFGLHPLAIEDCTDDDQVPKLEEYPQNTFVIVNALGYADGKLAVDEVGLFIGDSYLITVSTPGSDSPCPLSGMERIVAQDMETVRQGPAYLMHVILDQVVDRKFDAIEALEEQVDAAEEAIVADLQGFTPKELLRLRRDLLTLRKSLFHEREILVKICRKDCPQIPEGAIVHYRDIYDHLAKLLELAEAYRDIVTTLMEMYLSMLNNQMARAANQTNSSVRRMTVVMTIFMPLTLLAGVGGMSEWSMMTGSDNWRVAYPAFLLAMALIGVASYFLLRRIESRSE